MSSATNKKRPLALLLTVAGVVFALANVLVLSMATKGTIAAPIALELYRSCPPCVIYFVVAPLFVTLLAVLALRQVSAGTAPAAASEQPARETGESSAKQDPSPAAADGALQILALLQREGRFLDFLAEELSGYSDAQIGAAARAIHAGCRKALEGRLELEPIVGSQEGSEVTLEAGFDAEEIRLVGDVRGGPPFRGIVQHAGWRARRFELPRVVAGTNLRILAPAEVEIPQSITESRA